MHTFIVLFDMQYMYRLQSVCHTQTSKAAVWECMYAVNNLELQTLNIFAGYLPQNNLTRKYSVRLVFR